MSVQVKRRREAASFLSTFVGAQAELIVDTTNSRVQVHDGTTAGGWPAAKLSEAVTNTRTAVSDAAYTALVSDRTIAYTAITAARVVSLPAASAYPTGTRLIVVDESGSCSATNTITLSRAGSDTIDGATSAVICSAYGYLALQGNGSNRWTVIDQATSNLTAVGIGTAADPNNPLSVYGTSALFNSAGNFNFTINKAASTNTASTIYEDGFSARAQVGLCGDDNFHFKVSSDGSTWHDALDITASSGLVTANFGLTITGATTITSGTINNTAIGGTTPAAGTFTTVASNSDASIHGMTIGLGAGAIISNISLGTNALAVNTTGSSNVAIGIDTLLNNTTGIYNTAIGAYTLFYNTTGNYNFACGGGSLSYNTTGNYNAACGVNALAASATGNANIAFGQGALIAITTSSYNSGIGVNALGDLGTAVSAGSFAVGVGYTIVSVGTTNFTSIGASSNTVGVTFTATGVGSGTGTAFPLAANTNTAIGYNTARGLVSGTNNTIIGAQVTGLSANLSGTIILATGDGTIRTDYNSTTPGTWTFAMPVTVAKYTVSTLPAPGVAGRMAFASNCRMFNGAGTQEGAGSGTGGLVVDNGTAWKIAGTNVTAIA